MVPPLAWGLLAALAALAIYQAWTLYALQGRVDRLLDRAEDVRAASKMDLESTIDLFLLVSADDGGVSIRKLKKARGRANVWLQDFCQRKGVANDTHYVLRGALHYHISRQAGNIVEGAVGRLEGEDLEERLEATHRFNFRVARSVLGQELGEAYEEEMRASWDLWLEALAER